jgi:hypothetical protein
MHSHKTPSASEAILSYLDAQPDDEDSLEGIARWWIIEVEVELGVNTVRDALAELVAEGKVTACQGSNGCIMYRRLRPADDTGSHAADFH